MSSLLRAPLVLLALFTLLTGGLYPALVTGIAQLAFPDAANGSLVERNGEIVGSIWIGQSFDDPRYFWGRPSATSPSPYHAAASSGSNLGPSNPALESAVRDRVSRLRDADPENAGKPIPVDLVTASGSGLDPHVSPAAALYQAPRVARARGLPEPRVRELVQTAVEERMLGVFGEPRVNVLKLNLALDGLSRPTR